VTLAALQAELDRGHLVAIAADYTRHGTTVVSRVRGAHRALELLELLRRVGFRPVASLPACDVPNPLCCANARPFELKIP